MGKVKFGIIGTGMIAQIHADAIKLTDNSELVMVYDKIVEKAKDFAAKNNCQYAETLEEFLASDIEAVTIGTPSGLHGGAAIAAAQAKKHILCEKPLEVTVEKTDAILDACRQNNVILLPVFQLRYSKTVEIIKDAIDSGRLGKIVLASASVRWYRNEEYYLNAGWRGTWALDGGGALMNQGIHTLDLLLYFNGKVKEIFAKSANILHKSIEVEDTVGALLTFENGSAGYIEASTACGPGFPRKIEISGTKGSIIMEDDKITRWQFTEELPTDAEIRSNAFAGEALKGGSSNPKAITCEGHRRQITELANAIRGIAPLKMSAADGRSAVETICGIYESARSGKPVKL
ncbi:MAG: Gfo/Idh/MocA family oxidoreductase [Lentisphaeria bacterium]|nr:Gfo/Idh/MocA family oxidoreductase [Lentisphaeria bacterium]